MTVHLRDVEVDGARTNVTVSGDSTVAVGAPARAQPGDLVLDGRGGALLPGLHDHHLHLAALAAATTSVPVGPDSVHDARGLADALRRADREADEGAWLRAVGYHESVAGDLDRWSLDRLVAGRPLRVQHRSGALWTVNTQGLERLGLLSGSMPEGCEVDADGTPTGRLWRLDRWLASRLDSSPPDFAPVGRLLLSLGVTGVTDMTPYREAADFAVIGAAVVDGELPQEVTVTGGPELEPADLPPGLRIGPAKLLLADHDLPTLDELTARMRAARQARRSIAVHCVTRVSLVLTLAAFAEVGTVAGDRIEHGAVVPRELDDVIRRAGLVVVTQPNFVVERGDEYRTSVEHDDLDVLWRCASLLDAGVAVGAGTDAPFGRPDPWALVAAAAERRTPSGEVLQPTERLERRRALELLLGGADAPGGPSRRVAVGQPSDLCLLDAPLADALAAAPCNPVRAVLRAGRVVYGEGA